MRHEMIEMVDGRLEQLYRDVREARARISRVEAALERGEPLQRVTVAWVHALAKVETVNAELGV